MAANGRQRTTDLAVCNRVGWEFGLGEVQAITSVNSAAAAVGCLWVVALGPLVIGVAVAAVPTAPPAVRAGAVAVAILGALGALRWFPRLALVKSRVPVNRWCVYTGGIAQLDAAEPPRALRWHEVESITITADNVDYGEESPAGYALITCRLTGDGTEINLPSRGLDDMALAVHQALSPRFVPPLLHAYDSGAQVIISDVRVDQAGITTGGWHRDWHEVKSVRMHHPSRATAAIATMIELNCHVKRDGAAINPNWLPSGIFLGDVVRYAAARHGVPVKG